MAVGAGPFDPRFFIQYTMLEVHLIIAILEKNGVFTVDQLIQMNQMLNIIQFPVTVGTTPLTRPATDLIDDWVFQVYNPIGLEEPIF